MKKRTFYIVLAGISILVALAGLVCWISLLRSPYLGFRFERVNGQWMIASVASEGPAARFGKFAGKPVTAIGDWKLEPYDLEKNSDLVPDWKSYRRWWKGRAYFAGQVRVGVPVHLTIREGPESRIVEIIPSRFPLSEALLRSSWMTLSGLVFLVIGLVIALKKPDDPRASIFLFFAFSVGSLFLLAGPILSDDIGLNFGVSVGFEVWSELIMPYTTISFFHFSLVFPRRKKIAERRAAIAALYLLPLLVQGLYQPRFFFPALQIQQMFCLIGGMAVMIQSYATPVSPEEKAQIRWVLWGTVVGTMIVVSTYMAPILMNWRAPYNANVAALGAALLPVTMAAAIMKYRLLDIDTLVDNSIVYTMTLSVLILLDVGVIQLFDRFRNTGVPISGPVAIAVAVWLVVFAYIPVRNYFQRRVQKLLGREAYNPNEVSIRLSQALVTAADPGSVAERAIKVIVETLHPKGGAAYLCHEGVLSGWPHTEQLPGSFIEEAKSQRGPQPIYALASGSGLPQGYSGGVLVPIVGSSRLLGFFLLKEKEAGQLYRREDLALLSNAAGQAALALEHAYLMDQSQRKERESSEERDRISREIHDGAGSSLSNAILTLELIERERSEGPATLARIRSLKQLLTEGLTDLRNLIWAVEAEESTLGDFASHLIEKFRLFLERADLEPVIEVELENDRISISPTIRLNGLRMVQESLTNVIKHADASRVFFSIRERGGKIILTIKDNGKGFEASENNHSGHGLRNLRKRAREIGAELRFISGIGHGTEVVIHLSQLPLPPPPRGS